MTRVAFYAPLKSPADPVPSGDRAMARALLAALKAGGVSADVPSILTTRDKVGNAERQDQLFAQADAEIKRLTPLGQAAGWQAWITYHSYYKAPDLVGPAVAKILGLPYLMIEATRARKRLIGPWARFAQAAENACNAADVIFYLTHRDAESLRDYGPSDQELIHLRPFLPHDTLPTPSKGHGPMLSVGMMREGDKMQSYALIAQTLALLKTPDWELLIAGDGPMRNELVNIMAPFGTRVRFAGALAAQDMRNLYASCALHFWPGVNEAFGMAYLEAQAAGLPVIAQARPGVCDVLAPGSYPAPRAGPTAMVDMLDGMLSDPLLRHAAGQKARAYVAQHHLMPAATRTLCGVLAKVIA